MTKRLLHFADNNTREIVLFPLFGMMFVQSLLTESIFHLVYPELGINKEGFEYVLSRVVGYSIPFFVGTGIWIFSMKGMRMAGYAFAAIEGAINIALSQYWMRDLDYPWYMHGAAIAVALLVPTSIIFFSDLNYKIKKEDVDVVNKKEAETKELIEQAIWQLKEHVESNFIPNSRESPELLLWETHEKD